MDVRAYNREAWDREVARKNPWTIPVDSSVIARARQGDPQILLTPTRPVPKDWLPELAGREVLCLASGGGQQGPTLAAAGSRVTVFDNSPAQLAQDRQVAARESLALTTVEGGMADLSAFADETFDLIVHPCSNCFVPDIQPVWREAYRVLKRHGRLLAGFTNPVRYLFAEGMLDVAHRIPYSDLTDRSAEEIKQLQNAHEPLEFGHTLEAQLAGQLRAGFLLEDLYEDRYPAEANDPLSAYLDTFMATLAFKP